MSILKRLVSKTKVRRTVREISAMEALAVSGGEGGCATIIVHNGHGFPPPVCK